MSSQEVLRVKWEETTNECKRLKDKLDSASKDISVLESKLNSARGWLDAERQQRKKVETDRDCLARQLEEVRRVLLTDPRYTISDETKLKLPFLNGATNGNRVDHLNTIAESDSAMSGSDVSFSRSDSDFNNLDDIPRAHNEKKHRLSCRDEASAAKKRKSYESEGCFTLAAQPAQPLKFVDPVEVPVEKICNAKEKCASSAVKEINSRSHNFVAKGSILPDSCLWCSKKIVFGWSVLKCVNCKAIVHVECRDKVSTPCVPGTPTKKTGGTISDFAPVTSPMIPAIVICCVSEIERKGLNELGIYRYYWNYERHSRSNHAFSFKIKKQCQKVLKNSVLLLKI